MSLAHARDVVGNINLKHLLVEIMQPEIHCVSPTGNPETTGLAHSGNSLPASSLIALTSL
jgi:hypothetical protein